MVLTAPWVVPVAIGVAVLFAVAAVIVDRWARRRAPADAASIAYAARAYARPAARRRIRRQRVASVLLAAVAMLGVFSAGVIVARPVEVTVTRTEQNTRDIVLCLDVSGSMRAVDQRIIDTFRILAGQLEGERIALVVFDASPQGVFPLTADYAFIREQLKGVSAAISGEKRGREATFMLREGTRFGPALSAVGDGLRGCTLQFDGEADQRSRTIILASDNDPVGQPLITLSQAVDGAVAAGATVMALAPGDSADAEIDALRAELTRTGGEVYHYADGAGVQAIAEFVRDRESTMTAGSEIVREEDRSGPALLFLVAVTGVLLVVARKVL